MVQMKGQLVTKFGDAAIFGSTAIINWYLVEWSQRKIKKPMRS